MLITHQALKQYTNIRVSLQFSCTTLTNLDISIQRDSKYKCKMWGLLVDNEMDTDEFD